MTKKTLKLVLLFSKCILDFNLKLLIFNLFYKNVVLVEY